jgi:hypothetical protein
LLFDSGIVFGFCVSASAGPLDRICALAVAPARPLGPVGPFVPAVPFVPASPFGPVSPFAPCGPAGRVPPKSAAVSERFFTLAPVTAFFFSCAVPTLFRASFDAA